METLNSQFVQAGPQIPASPITPPVVQPNSDKSAVAVVTGDLAKQDLNNIRTDYNTVLQNIKAQQKAAGMSPLQQQALGDTPYDQLLKANPAAAYYRAYGREGTPEEIAKFSGVTEKKTPNLDALEKAIGDGYDPNKAWTTLPDGSKVNVDANGQPLQGGTTPVDDFQAKMDTETSKMLTALDQYKSGTLPLTPTQLAQIESLKKQFEQMKEQQIQFNKNFEGGSAIIEIASGRNRYAPEVSMGRMQSVVNSGLARVREIDIKAMDAVSAMTQGFQTDNLKLIRESYEVYTRALKEKQERIDKVQKEVQAEVKAQEEFKIKASRQGAIADLFRQGITDVAEMMDYLNYDEEGNLVGDVTLEEINDVMKVLNPPENLSGLSADYKTFLDLKKRGDPRVANMDWFQYNTALSNSTRKASTVGSGGAGVKPGNAIVLTAPQITVLKTRGIPEATALEIEKALIAGFDLESIRKALKEEGFSPQLLDVFDSLDGGDFIKKIWTKVGIIPKESKDSDMSDEEKAQFRKDLGLE